MPPVELAVEGLEAHYSGVRALRGVSLELERGTCAAVLGANGAGKSTLLKAVSGLVPYTGVVKLDGRPLQGRPDEIARQGVGHVLEGRQVFTHLTVRENLELGRFAQRDGEGCASLEELFEFFPVLGEKLHRRAGELSGGEQQTVAIARGLISRPRVLLMDEPSLGLSPRAVQLLTEAVQRVRDSWGMTLLVSEQSIALAVDLATSFYILRQGQVVHAGPADFETLWGTLHEAYLGAGQG